MHALGDGGCNCKNITETTLELNEQFAPLDLPRQRECKLSRLSIHLDTSCRDTVVHLAILSQLKVRVGGESKGAISREGLWTNLLDGAVGRGGHLLLDADLHDSQLVIKVDWIVVPDLDAQHILDRHLNMVFVSLAPDTNGLPTCRHQIFLSIPQGDVPFFKTLASQNLKPVVLLHRSGVSLQTPGGLGSHLPSVADHPKPQSNEMVNLQYWDSGECGPHLHKVVLLVPDGGQRVVLDDGLLGGAGQEQLAVGVRQPVVVSRWQVLCALELDEDSPLQGNIQNLIGK